MVKPMDRWMSQMGLAIVDKPVEGKPGQWHVTVMRATEIIMDEKTITEMLAGKPTTAKGGASE